MCIEVDRSAHLARLLREEAPVLNEQLLRANKRLLLHVWVGVRHERHDGVLALETHDHLPARRVMLHELAQVVHRHRERCRVSRGTQQCDQHAQHLKVLLLEARSVLAPEAVVLMPRAPAQRARQQLPAILLERAHGAGTLGQALLQEVQRRDELVVRPRVQLDGLHGLLAAQRHQLRRVALAEGGQRQRRHAHHLLLGHALEECDECLEHGCSSHRAGCRGLERHQPEAQPALIEHLDVQRGRRGGVAEATASGSCHRHRRHTRAPCVHLDVLEVLRELVRPARRQEHGTRGRVRQQRRQPLACCGHGARLVRGALQLLAQEVHQRVHGRVRRAGVRHRHVALAFATGGALEAHQVQVDARHARALVGPRSHDLGQRQRCALLYPPRGLLQQPQQRSVQRVGATRGRCTCVEELRVR
mmetsp:Transcript_18692/g.58067  ORF Transcript_18692/g.58067 Transcript_18692/m.58067 type:complete len:418 (-) Transcript_18692:471-1724(-)